MGQYLPVLAMLVLGTLFGALSLLASKLLAPRNTNAAKVAPYECGIVPGRETAERFPVSFYLIAMLFIMFDIEIIFLYPYAVAHEELGVFGFGAIVLFAVVFFLTFVYEVAKGGLDWGPVRQLRRPLLGDIRSDAPLPAHVRRVGLEGREEAA